MSSPAARHRKRQLKILAGLIISISCLWWAVRGMLKDPNAWTQIVAAFRQADYRSIPVILLILGLFYWLKAWRWRLMLSPAGDYRTTRDLLPPIMIGFAFNNILPARIGEVIRVTVFSRQQKQSITVTASSVVLERVFDGMAILFYFAIGLLFVDGLAPHIKNGAIAFAIMASCVVVGALAYVIWTKLFVQLFESVLKRVPFIPKGFVDSVCRILERGAQGLSALKDVRLVFAMMMISLVKWWLNAMLVLLSLWSFNLPHSLPIVLVLLGAIAFGVAIPSSPGYVGVMQAVFIEVMKFFTTNQEAVFASSIFFQFTQWIPVTIVGLIFFAASGMRLNQMDAGPSTSTNPQLSPAGHDEAGPLKEVKSP